MTATSTVRTATEARLVALIAALDDFQGEPDDDALWWATPPLNSSPKNRRMVVIGTPDGALDPEAMAAGQDPATDSWTISCGVVAMGEDEALPAKQLVEDAFNAVADLLARDNRLTLVGQPHLGVRDVRISAWEGPNWSWEQGQASLAWIDFDITCAADIRRNP